MCENKINCFVPAKEMLALLLDVAVKQQQPVEENLVRKHNVTGNLDCKNNSIL